MITFHFKTVMGKAIEFITCFDQKQMDDFNSIGNSGKTVDGTPKTRIQFLTEIFGNNFTLRQDQFDKGDFCEEFTLIINNEVKKDIILNRKYGLSTKLIKNAMDKAQKIGDSRYKKFFDYYKKIIRLDIINIFDNDMRYNRDTIIDGIQIKDICSLNDTKLTVIEITLKDINDCDVYLISNYTFNDGIVEKCIDNPYKPSTLNSAKKIQRALLKFINDEDNNSEYFDSLRKCEVRTNILMK